MRICMVTHSLYESDHRVMRYAETLAARGDEVEVIALRKEGKSKEEVIAGVRVFRVHMRTFKEKKRASFFKGLSFFFLKAFRLLTMRHLKTPYDLLHIHSIPDFLVFVALVPKLTGAKVILDIHDILPELYASKFKAKEQSLGFRTMLMLERVSGWFANHVIIANHIWHERLIRRCLPSDKCTTLLNYPDRSIFYPRAREQNSDEFVVLFPGTLNQHQGLDIAIRAFAKIRDLAPKAMFHIYGEGRTQDVLLSLVKQLKLQDRVIFKAFVPIRDIALVMANADLAVVPKRKDSFGNEAFSTKILEFMSVGVPVIVSDTKIDQYYFNDSVVTFFEDGNESELAQSMLLLMNDANLRESMIKNGSEFVKAFDWGSNKSTYTRLVDSLVERQPLSTSARLPASRPTGSEGV